MLFDHYAAAHFPFLPQITRWARSCTCCGHATLALFPIKIFGTDGPGFSILSTVKVTQIYIQAIKLLLCFCRKDNQNKHQKNRGLFFHCDQLLYCGLKLTVFTRVPMSSILIDTISPSCKVKPLG